MKLPGSYQTPAHIFLILLQAASALSPFIATYLLWRYLKKVRLRIAKRYFEHVKKSEYWQTIIRQNFIKNELLQRIDAGFAEMALIPI